MTNLDSILKSRDITLPMKVRLVKVMVFPVMWELDYKKMLITQELILLYCGVGKTCESPLDYKQIQSAHPKGNQSWIFIGRTDVKLKLILWPLDAKNCLIWKDPYAGKDWRWEEKGTTGDEMVGWHHQLNGHEFEQAPGASDGQGGLACHSPWGCKESDVTEQLNWSDWYLPQSLSPLYTVDCSEQRAEEWFPPCPLGKFMSFILRFLIAQQLSPERSEYLTCLSSVKVWFQRKGEYIFFTASPRLTDCCSS